MKRLSCRFLYTDAAQTAGAGAEQLANLFRLRRARRGCANRIGELNFMQLVIATKQCQNRTRLAVDGSHENQRLDLPIRRRASRET